MLLSAGAIESPKLLMLSGIGDGAALQAMGIESRVHAPEVGKNLQDHFMVRFAFRTKPADTLNESMANPLKTAKMGLDWALRRRGHMTIGASEASLFARVLPGSEEAEVQYQFVNFSLDTQNQGDLGEQAGEAPGLHLQLLPVPAGQPRRAHAAQPRCRGQAAHPGQLPDRAGRRAGDAGSGEAGAADRGDQALRRPGGRGIVARPGDADATTTSSNTCARSGTTVYHPCGTNRMGADDRAVVDTELRVRGVEGLRVVDASVFPLVPSSNIHPAVLMTAERAAEMIKASARAGARARRLRARQRHPPHGRRQPTEIAR